MSFHPILYYITCIKYELNMLTQVAKINIFIYRVSRYERVNPPERRVSIFRKRHMKASFLLVEAIFHVTKPRITNQNLCFRFSLPVHRRLKISFPVWGNTTKTCGVPWNIFGLWCRYGCNKCTYKGLWFSRTSS